MRLRQGRGLNKTRTAIAAAVAAMLGVASTQQFAIGTEYEIVCRAPDGSEKWVEKCHNLVVTAGLNDILDKYFKGSAYTAAFYVMLTDGTPTVAAGDTMSSHAGWGEVTAYDELVRQTFTAGTVSGGAVDNSASKATFTISTNSTTIGGAALTTNSTKSGTTGTLFGAAAFTAGDKLADDGDTLEVTATITVTAA